MLPIEWTSFTVGGVSCSGILFAILVWFDCIKTKPIPLDKKLPPRYTDRELDTKSLHCIVEED
jgi:hypothetical protein